MITPLFVANRGSIAPFPGRGGSIFSSSLSGLDPNSAFIASTYKVCPKVPPMSSLDKNTEFSGLRTCALISTESFNKARLYADLNPNCNQTWESNFLGYNLDCMISLFDFVIKQAIREYKLYIETIASGFSDTPELVTICPVNHCAGINDFPDSVKPNKCGPSKNEKKHSNIR